MTAPNQSDVEAERWNRWEQCEHDGHDWGTETTRSYRTVRACGRCGAESDGKVFVWNVKVNGSRFAVKPS